MNNSGGNCWKEGLLLRALDDELPTRQAWLVRLHLDNCESCQARFQALRQISSRVAELHQLALPLESTARFAARLDEEDAQERQNLSWWRWFARPRPLWQRIAGCAAFGMALIASFRLGRQRPGVPVHRIVQTAPLTAAAPVPKRLVADVRVKPVRPARRRLKRSMPRMGSSRAAAAALEVVTPFFSLPFSDAALPLDQATVIRVELPRSALELAGLPVDADRRNERIRADLVLGADGLARAIRFIE